MHTPCCTHGWDSQAKQEAAVLQVHEVQTQGQGEMKLEPTVPSPHSVWDDLSMFPNDNCVCVHSLIIDTMIIVYVYTYSFLIFFRTFFCKDGKKIKDARWNSEYWTEYWTPHPHRKQHQTHSPVCSRHRNLWAEQSTRLWSHIQRQELKGLLLIFNRCWVFCSSHWEDSGGSWLPLGFWVYVNWRERFLQPSSGACVHAKHNPAMARTEKMLLQTTSKGILCTILPLPFPGAVFLTAIISLCVQPYKSRPKNACRVINCLLAAFTVINWCCIKHGNLHAKL